MARAFTDEEKLEIRKRLLETALELFHDNGTKSLSIAELTSRAGIAQGSFYSFWSNKNALIADLVAYRARQKLEILERDFPKSVEDPAGFLSGLLFESSVDMTRKIREKPVYEEAFRIFMTADATNVSALSRLYGEFLGRLSEYWLERGAVRRVDVKGLENAVVGSFVLCAESALLDAEYFEGILKAYADGVVRAYIER